jgi:hypothetical protein
MANKNTKSSVSTPARILALVLSLLVTGSALTGLAYLIIGIFAK